jgi:hypothetical protein
MYIFHHISLSSFYNKKMLEAKVVDKINTQFCIENLSSKKSCFFQIMWKNIVQSVRPQLTIWRIPNATDTYSECIILTAFPLQQMVTRTHLNVTLYVHSLSVYYVRIYSFAPYIRADCRKNISCLPHCVLGERVGTECQYSLS